MSEAKSPWLLVIWLSIFNGDGDDDGRDAGYYGDDDDGDGDNDDDDDYYGDGDGDDKGVEVNLSVKPGCNLTMAMVLGSVKKMADISNNRGRFCSFLYIFETDMKYIDSW